MDPIAPMEALLAEALPDEPGWQFEPKWDGFRCIAVRDGDAIDLWSKSGKPLARYFPEVAAMLLRLSEQRFVLDGELLIGSGDAVSFDALQMRLHPAASRIAQAVRRDPGDVPRLRLPRARRRPPRRRAARRAPQGARSDARRRSANRCSCSPPRPPTAARRCSWLDRGGGALDGVIAKRLADPYAPGKRAMVKVKQRRTADCVVGGFRYGVEARRGRLAPARALQ